MLTKITQLTAHPTSHLTKRWDPNWKRKGCAKLTAPHDQEFGEIFEETKKNIYFLDIITTAVTPLISSVLLNHNPPYNFIIL